MYDILSVLSVLYTHLYNGIYSQGSKSKFTAQKSVNEDSVSSQEGYFL